MYWSVHDSSAVISLLPDRQIFPGVTIFRSNCHFYWKWLRVECKLFSHQHEHRCVLQNNWLTESIEMLGWIYKNLQKLFGNSVVIQCAYTYTNINIVALYSYVLCSHIYNYNEHDIRLELPNWWICNKICTKNVFY